MVGLHYFCAIVLTNAFNYFDNPNGNEMPLFLFFLNSCPVAALLMGAMLASSMWVLAETSFGRVCAIAGLIFGWIIQYWIIFFLVGSAFRTFGVHTFLVVLMLSLILPGVIVSDAWRAAERKIRKLA
jgi:hypothetical protein